MIVMELSCIPVPDIGEGRAADQEQDGGNGEDAFHGELRISNDKGFVEAACVPCPKQLRRGPAPAPRHQIVWT